MNVLEINHTAGAEQCGVSRSVFSYWMSKKRAALPSMDNLEAVAKFLQKTPAEVLEMYPPQYKVRASRSTVDGLATMRAELNQLRRKVDKQAQQIRRLEQRLGSD